MTSDGDPSLLISARLVLTGTDSPPIASGAVLVRNGLIVEVGTRDALSRSEFTRELHLPHATLLPGLIDCHEHLVGTGRFAAATSDMGEPDAMHALVFAQQCRRTLERGITTVRVPGSIHAIDLTVRRAIDEGFVVGPRLVCAGEAISMTGGHGAAVGTEADGAAECARAARRQLAAGADFVKVMASGGVGITRAGERPTHPELSVEEMEAIVRAAHAAGKRVTAHADGVEGISNALEAGVDCIEHGIYLTDEHARRMAASGVFLVPTLSTMIGIARRGTEFGLDPMWIEIAEEILDVHRRSFRSALDAGVTYATGTDGYGDMVDEIAEFLTYGIEPYRAIQAATSHAAAVIGPSANYGALQEGRSADVIACDGDPLEAIEQLREIRLVMLGGDISTIDEGSLG